LLVATGGTIASMRQRDGGVSVALRGADLLATVGDLGRHDVEIVDVAQGASWNLGLDDMAKIALTARDADASGVVITHGTDTLEETAFLTELLTSAPARPAKAIVVTGAMRNADDPDHLRAAIALARSGSAKRWGVLVCLAGEVHEARWVTKTDTQALDTFRSPARGPVDVVTGTPTPRPAVPLPPPDA